MQPTVILKAWVEILLPIAKPAPMPTSIARKVFRIMCQSVSLQYRATEKKLEITTIGWVYPRAAIGPREAKTVGTVIMFTDRMPDRSSPMEKLYSPRITSCVSVRSNISLFYKKSRTPEIINQTAERKDIVMMNIRNDLEVKCLTTRSPSISPAAMTGTKVRSANIVVQDILCHAKKYVGSLQIFTMKK